jgi:hypothetical protein
MVILTILIVKSMIKRLLIKQTDKRLAISFRICQKSNLNKRINQSKPLTYFKLMRKSIIEAHTSKKSLKTAQMTPV